MICTSILTNGKIANTYSFIYELIMEIGFIGINIELNYKDKKHRSVVKTIYF